MRLARSHVVGRPAGVRPAVLRDHADNVQGHITEIVDGSEPVTDRHRSPVLEPFDGEVGVGDRLEFGLEVRVLTLDKVIETARFVCEVGCNKLLNVFLPRERV